MTEPVNSDTILIDGPMAGHSRTIPQECKYSYAIVIPQPFSIAAFDPEKAVTATDDVVYYQLRTITYTDQLGLLRPVRIGWSESARPSERNLLEHVPTGLAEQGVIPWEYVPHTALDRMARVPLLEYGDVAKDCAITVTDPYTSCVADLDAVCARGWRTERVALDRRSWLVRAAYRHALGQDARRERFKQPIRLVAAGSGGRPDCYGGIAEDEFNGRLYGKCRCCGWQTEWVEYFRAGPLRALCQAHTGPDGVRRVRDQLLASLGLPPAGGGVTCRG
jgi:hypothetical protein